MFMIMIIDVKNIQMRLDKTVNTIQMGGGGGA